MKRGGHPTTLRYLPWGTFMWFVVALLVMAMPSVGVMDTAMAGAVCTPAGAVTASVAINTAGVWEGDRCAFNGFITLTLSSVTAANTLSLALVGGSVAAGTTNALVIAGLEAAVAAASGPMTITVEGLVFGDNAMLRFDKSLPPSSSLTLHKNTLSLTAINTRATVSTSANNFIVGILIGSATDALSFSGMIVTITNNTISAKRSGSPTLTASAIHIAATAISFTNACRWTIANNSFTTSATSSGGGAYSNGVSFSVSGRFRLETQSSLTFATNTIDSRCVSTVKDAATSAISRAAGLLVVSSQTVATQAIGMGTSSALTVAGNTAVLGVTNSDWGGCSSALAIIVAANSALEADGGSIIKVEGNAVTSNATGKDYSYGTAGVFFIDMGGASTVGGCSIVISNNTASVNALGATAKASSLCFDLGLGITFTSSALVEVMNNTIKGTAVSQSDTATFSGFQLTPSLIAGGSTVRMRLNNVAGTITSPSWMASAYAMRMNAMKADTGLRNGSTVLFADNTVRFTVSGDLTTKCAAVFWEGSNTLSKSTSVNDTSAFAIVGNSFQGNATSASSSIALATLFVDFETGLLIGGRASLVIANNSAITRGSTTGTNDNRILGLPKVTFTSTGGLPAAGEASITVEGNWVNFVNTRGCSPLLTTMSDTAVVGGTTAAIRFSNNVATLRSEDTVAALGTLTCPLLTITRVVGLADLAMRGNSFATNTKAHINTPFVEMPANSLLFLVGNSVRYVGTRTGGAALLPTAMFQLTTMLELEVGARLTLANNRMTSSVASATTANASPIRVLVAASAMILPSGAKSVRVGCGNGVLEVPEIIGTTSLITDNTLNAYLTLTDAAMCITTRTMSFSARVTTTLSLKPSLRTAFDTRTAPAAVTGTQTTTLVPTSVAVSALTGTVTPTTKIITRTAAVLPTQTNPQLPTITSGLPNTISHLSSSDRGLGLSSTPLVTSIKPSKGSSHTRTRTEGAVPLTATPPHGRATTTSPAASEGVLRLSASLPSMTTRARSWTGATTGEFVSDTTRLPATTDVTLTPTRAQTLPEAPTMTFYSRDSPRTPTLLAELVTPSTLTKSSADATQSVLPPAAPRTMVHSTSPLPSAHSHTPTTIVPLAPTPRLGSSAHQTVRDTVGAIGLSVGLVAIPAVVMQQGMAMAISRVAECDGDPLNGGEDPLDFVLHPLRFYIGEGTNRYGRGAVVGNVAIMAVFPPLCYYIVAPLVGRLGGMGVDEALLFVGWPSVALTPLPFLAEGIAMVSVALLSSAINGIEPSTSTEDAILGLMGLSAMLIAGGVWAHWVRRVLIARFGAFMLRPVRDGTIRWSDVWSARYTWQLVHMDTVVGSTGAIGGGDGIDEALLQEVPKGSCCDAASPPKPSSALAIESDRPPPADVQAAEAMSVQYAALVGTCWWSWALSIGCVLSALVGVLEGIGVDGSPSWCQGRWSLMASCMLLQCVVFLTCSVILEWAMLLLSNVALLVLVCLMSIRMYDALGDDAQAQLAEGMDITGLITSAIGIGQLVLGLLYFCWNLYWNRRARVALAIASAAPEVGLQVCASSPFELLRSPTVSAVYDSMKPTPLTIDDASEDVDMREMRGVSLTPTPADHNSLSFATNKSESLYSNAASSTDSANNSFKIPRFRREKGRNTVVFDYQLSERAREACVEDQIFFMGMLDRINELAAAEDGCSNRPSGPQGMGV